MKRIGTIQSGNPENVGRKRKLQILMNIIEQRAMKEKVRKEEQNNNNNKNIGHQTLQQEHKKRTGPAFVI